jgi:hypothetical protein
VKSFEAAAMTKNLPIWLLWFALVLVTVMSVGSGPNL